MHLGLLYVIVDVLHSALHFAPPAYHTHHGCFWKLNRQSSSLLGNQRYNTGGLMVHQCHCKDKTDPIPGTIDDGKGLRDLLFIYDFHFLMSETSGELLLQVCADCVNWKVLSNDPHLMNSKQSPSSLSFLSNLEKAKPMLKRNSS